MALAMGLFFVMLVLVMQERMSYFELYFSGTWYWYQYSTVHKTTTTVLVRICVELQRYFTGHLSGRSNYVEATYGRTGT